MHAWHELCMLDHWTDEKYPGEYKNYIWTKYFLKISSHIWLVLRIGILSGWIKLEVVQTEYLKSEYPYYLLYKVDSIFSTYIHT